MISIRKLAECLYLPANFLVRSDLLGWLSPPPQLSLLEQLEHVYCYKVDNVTDVDQRWTGLLDDGKGYCVPASTLNWLYYIGEPPNPQIDAGTMLNLALLGNQMDTDPETGTSFDNGIDGLIEWLDDRAVSALVIGATVSDGASIRIEHLRTWANLGGLVNVNMGRYVDDEGELERESGHRMTMVGLHQRDEYCEIVVHNPDNDKSDLMTQSATQNQKASLVEGQWNVVAV